MTGSADSSEVAEVVEESTSKDTKVTAEKTDSQAAARVAALQQDSVDYSAAEALSSSKTEAALSREPAESEDAPVEAVKPAVHQDKRLTQAMNRTAHLNQQLESQRAAKRRLLADFSALTAEHRPQSRTPSKSRDEGEQASEAALLKDARRRVQEHIALLHRYNETRDAALGLMGIVAEQRAVRLVDVQEEFGVTAKD